MLDEGEPSERFEARFGFIKDDRITDIGFSFCKDLRFWVYRNFEAINDVVCSGYTLEEIADDPGSLVLEGLGRFTFGWDVVKE